MHIYLDDKCNHDHFYFNQEVDTFTLNSNKHMPDYLWVVVVRNLLCIGVHCYVTM